MPRELTPQELAEQDRQVEQAVAQFAAGDTPSTAELLGVPPDLPHDDNPWWASLARERPNGAGGVPGRAEFPEGDDGHGETTEDPIEPSRRVDLGPFLDGSYEPPKPETGAPRDDGTRMLYASRWHTVIGPTGCGKSWFGLWHAAHELKAGNLVVYLHFEESTPGGTVGRLLLLGCTPEQIRQRFAWLDCDRRWKAAEYADELAASPSVPTLVVLDGINACCTKHGWHPNDPDAVGAYRYTFVTPATRLGGAVLSLGHPPKARDRQDERHGFGSTAWLDEVDGVGFRLVASKARPVGKGRSGSSSLHVVKDRYAEVEQHGVVDGDRDGWSYFGQFVVDASDPQWLTVRLTVRLAVPEASGDGQTRDRIDRLSDEVVRLLSEQEGRRVGSQRQLVALLRAARAEFDNLDLDPALQRLAQQGRVVWPEASRGQGRPVVLTALGTEDGGGGGERVVADPRRSALSLRDSRAQSTTPGDRSGAPQSGPEHPRAFGQGETWYRLDEHGEPHCRACGKPLSPAEYQTTPDAHDCRPTLPMEGDQQ